MRLWHWGVILGVLLFIIMLIAQFKKWYKVLTLTRRIAGVICLGGAIYFGGLGLIYIVSDIRAYIAINNKQISYAEGPGLGIAIGSGFLLCVTLPLVIMAVFLFKYSKRKG